MRKVFTLMAFAIILMCGQQAFAQLKIGYTNADVVLSQLPEAKTIEAELKAYNAQLSKELETKQAEFERKYKEYAAAVQAGTMTPVIREAKEKELQTLQQNLQEFQQKAQADSQKKQQDLLAPVFDKIQKAIDDIAKAENFDFVFSTDVAGGAPILLFAKEEHNITNKVIVKLGGTPLPATTEKKN
ncbi:MAG: OmpH family outer membrane protein [Thermoflexibacter sp.]|nr:OmpH family outer membrane protein [Thermoflexibacter sp.]